MATIKIKFITEDESILNLAENLHEFIAKIRELNNYLSRSAPGDWAASTERVPGGVLLTLRSDRCNDVVPEVKKRLLNCFYGNYSFNDDTLKYSATCSDRYQPNITNCAPEDIDMSDCCKDFYTRPYEYTLSRYRSEIRRKKEEEESWTRTLGRIAGDRYPDW